MFLWAVQKSFTCFALNKVATDALKFVIALQRQYFKPKKKNITAAEEKLQTKNL